MGVVLWWIYNICVTVIKEYSSEKIVFIFGKCLDFCPILWYCVVLIEKEAQPMNSVIKELWYGNIVPQSDSRNNSPEMKRLMEYIARHHYELLKTMTDEQKEIFEKFDACWSEYASFAEESIFEYAFRLGMKMVVEMLLE